VRAFYVTDGPETAALRERMHQIVEMPIHVLDPFSGPEQTDLHAPEVHGGFAGIVGLLHLQASRQGLPSNLIHPREPRPAEDPLRKRLAVGLGAAAVLLVAGIGTAAWQLSSLTSQVTAQVLKNAELDSELTLAEQDAKRIKALGDWNDHAIVWLDELYDLTERFPDPDKNSVRLSRLTAEHVDRGSKDKRVAKISLLGVTGDDHKPVDQLISKYVEDGLYRVDPKRLTRNAGPERRDGFTQQFEIPRIDLEKRPPDKYVRQLEEETSRGQGSGVRGQ
jgi:hypothetical protein